MQISTMIEYANGYLESVDLVAGMEQAGLDRVWVPEAYGFDGVSLMGFLASRTSRTIIASGILPIYTRTPALLAMTAAGLDALSGGRFELGVGASGPQVIEGWHGVRYDAPLGRTREVVDICRKVWARDAPLQHDGGHYRLPLPAEAGTGLGKPLKIITHPVRSRIPVWVAAIGDKNVELAAEVAEGWLPILFWPERAADVWVTSLAAGSAKRPEGLGPLQISAGGLLAIGDGPEVLAVRNRVRQQLALYIGGMGARQKNFYNTLACRYGFEREAALVQDLYLSGRREEAAAALPEQLVEGVSLIGPKSFVAERIAALREAGVTDLQVRPVPVGDQTSTDLIGTVRELAG